MNLPSETRVARLHSPLKKLELDEQMIEHRQDPLTGRRTIVLKGRRDYVKRYVQTDDMSLTETAERTRPGCPFCPEKAGTSTPRFPADLVAEGVIRVGQAKTFPSLFAHAEFNAVTIVSDRHYLKPGELGSEILADALEASVRYLRLVNEKNANVTWGAVLMNCLTPAGSTVVHPHMQALASDQPFNALSEMDRKAREYWQAKGSSFWKDLVMTEQEHMERYLGLLGDTDWIMAYSPVGNDEAWGITRECDDLVKISRVTLTNLAAGLSRVLHYYDECGIRSFNVAVCSPPFGASASHGSVVLKVASRYGFQSHNVNDVWGLRYFLDQSEVFDAPEDVATQMRRHFV